MQVASLIDITLFLLCGLVKQTNTTPKELCLIVCNGHGTKLNIKHD